MLIYRVIRRRFVLLPFVLALSACQTFDDASPPLDSWNAAPPPRVSSSQPRTDRTSGTSLLGNTRGGELTLEVSPPMRRLDAGEAHKTDRFL